MFSCRVRATAGEWLGGVHERMNGWVGWQLKETIGLLLADLNRALLAKVMPKRYIDSAFFGVPRKLVPR